jgi:pseudouridine synthase
VKAKSNIILITIHEGKKRQVRRMIEAVGLKVKNLKRTRINKLKLPDIPAGQFVVVKKSDIV